MVNSPSSWRAGRGAGLVIIALAWCAGLGAQPANDPSTLQRQITELQNSGKFADALPLTVRLVDLTKSRSGETSAEHADALETLGATYFFQSRHGEAEPYYQRALTIREKIAGPGHESVLAALDTLASLYRLSNRPELAEPLSARPRPVIQDKDGPARVRAAAVSRQIPIIIM